jgi:hypothetical protein
MKYWYHVSYQASTAKNDTFFGDATVGRSGLIDSAREKQSLREALLWAVKQDVPSVKNCVILNYVFLRVEDENGNPIQEQQRTS